MRPACRSPSSRCTRCRPPSAPASIRSSRRSTSATRSATAIGVAVDVYHVWWDPKLEQQIRRAGKKRILAYHICDWLVPTRDLLNDRGMMGDGVIDLPLIRTWIEAAGYAGFHEVEIFSELDWWQRDPDEVLRTVRERYARCT